jgi:Phytanoyl-CoA dioxygenase (PhyH)
MSDVQRISATIQAMRSRASRLHRAIHQGERHCRHAATFKSWIMYHLSQQPLTDLQRLLLDSLRRHGIAITTVEDLGAQDAFEELEKEVWALETRLSSSINQTREQADTSGFKTYFLELLGPRPVLDPKDIFVRFGLQPVILNLVNAYLGMYVRLKAFNVWHNFPSSAPPRDLQLWHRDPPDRHLVKLFVYLTDVTDPAGPLAYNLGTHRLRSIKSRPRVFAAEGTGALPSADEPTSVVVPRGKWLTTMGPKGTVVLADSRGYHMAVLARDRDRILYNCMFTSQASPFPEYFERKTPIRIPSDRALAFALDG